MKGYGWSIWLVPQVRSMFRFEHIPHITYKTNLVDIPHIPTDNKHYRVRFITRRVVPLKTEYEIDPLYGAGWYCDVEELDIGHLPHMTTEYSKERIINPVQHEPPYGYISCKLVVADTRSLNPSDWYIL